MQNFILFDFIILLFSVKRKTAVRNVYVVFFPFWLFNFYCFKTKRWLAMYMQLLTTAKNVSMYVSRCVLYLIKCVWRLSQWRWSTWKMQWLTGYQILHDSFLVGRAPYVLMYILHQVVVFCRALHAAKCHQRTLLRRVSGDSATCDADTLVVG